MIADFNQCLPCSPKTIEEVCKSSYSIVSAPNRGKSDTTSYLKSCGYRVGYPGRNLQMDGKSEKAIRHALVPTRNRRDLDMRPRDVSSTSKA